MQEQMPLLIAIFVVRIGIRVGEDEQEPRPVARREHSFPVKEAEDLWLK